MLFLSNKTKHILALLGAGVVSVIYISLNWVGFIDDAYIFFRYAHNLSQGYGYVFNVGQPVEGTTSVTWTVLLAVLDTLHIPAELSAKILGFLCVLAILFLLGIASYKASIPLSITLFVFSLLIFDRNLILSVMMGLETGLYALLLLAICIVSIWYSQSQESFPAVLMGGIGVLLFLTRPESLILLVLIGCGIVFCRYKCNGRYSAVPILIWALGILVVTLWRWSTFGDFIPNSARAKAVLDFSDLRWAILWPRIVAGTIYVKNLFAKSWLLAILGLVGLVSIRKSFGGFAAFSILFTGISVALINSGDWMPMSRLLTPYLPVVALLAMAGLNSLRLLIGIRWVKLFDLALILIAVLVTLNSFWLLQGKHFFVAARWPGGVCYRKAGLVLRPYLSSGTLVAPEAVGELGYTLMEIPILDFFGLTDPYIARNGVIPIETYTMGKHHYEYVMQQDPDLFLFHSNIVNHIPFLNPWGYSQRYETFRIADLEEKCELLVGVKDPLAPLLLPVLQQNFEVQVVDTEGLQKNPAATWPEGER